MVFVKNSIQVETLLVLKVLTNVVLTVFCLFVSCYLTVFVGGVVSSASF